MHDHVEKPIDRTAPWFRRLGVGFSGGFELMPCSIRAVGFECEARWKGDLFHDNEGPEP